MARAALAALSCSDWAGLDTVDLEWASEAPFPLLGSLLAGVRAVWIRGWTDLPVYGLYGVRALIRLSLASCGLTALDVSASLLLTRLDASTNALAALDVSANTALTGLLVGVNQLTALDVSALTLLAHLDAQDNLLTEGAVDAILVALVAHSVDNGTVALDGTGNAAPSATGLTAKGVLEGRGWTVTVNS